MRKAASSDAGFGLIEAIVALAIASFALTALYQSIGSALHAAARVQVHDAALVYARSQLDTIGTDGRLQAGVSSGKYGNGLTWRMTVLNLATGPNASNNPSQPFWIALDVFDLDGVSLLNLSTAKVSSEPK